MNAALLQPTLKPVDTGSSQLAKAKEAKEAKDKGRYEGPRDRRPPVGRPDSFSSSLFSDLGDLPHTQAH